MALCPLGRGEHAAVLCHVTAAAPSACRVLTGGVLGTVGRHRLVELRGDACDGR